MIDEKSGGILLISLICTAVGAYGAKGPIGLAAPQQPLRG